MRLLKKTIGSYFIFSAVLLLVAIPFFYVTLQRIMVANIDEKLITTKTLIIPRVREAISHNDPAPLSYFDYQILFEKSGKSRASDSLYTSELADSFTNRSLPQRFLTSQIYINQQSYRLMIRTPLSDKNELIKRIVAAFMILLLVLLSGLLIINRILSKKIWKPFYNTLERLHNYRVDKQAVLILKPSSVKEFNDLNRAIEQLAQRDSRAYSSQKEFAENASHEMQSPLAVFQSKLELLMQTKPLNEDQAALIDDLANASQRMGRLNKSLILLTKIENNQFPEKETISIQELLQKLIDQYGFQMEQKKIHIAVNIQKNIILDASSTLLEIMIGNLLSNAIRHNIPDGTIAVLLKENEIIVRNSGKPFALDMKKIFNRFQKESADIASLGLGLEIVKKIADLYHFSVHYEYTEELHTFSVRFGA
jgi:signal transduction histidine kinase